MKKNNKKNLLTIILVLVVAFGLLGFNSFKGVVSNNSSSQSGVAGAGSSSIPCINPNLPFQYHIHPHLQLIINGKSVEIPANIGTEPGCERTLHAHDNTGAIHIEPNFYQEFTLADFFSVWGRPFSHPPTGGQILNYQTDAGHEIVMTVDGQPNSEYQNLVLKDNQQIVIEYRSR